MTTDGIVTTDGIKSRGSGLLAVSAHCRVCHGDGDQDHWNARNAMGLAAQHARRTGHHTVVEQTIVVSFNDPRWIK